MLSEAKSASGGKKYLEHLEHPAQAVVLLFIILTGTNLFASAPDTLWTRTFGGAAGDGGYSVQQTQDSGFIIVGQTWSFGIDSGDVYLIRTNSSGDTLWTKTFGGAGNDFGWSVKQTQDNGFIIAGYTKSFGAGGYDVYLIKTNSSGDTIWTKTFGGTGSDYGYFVQQTQDGGFIIAGTTFSFGTNGDVYLIKTNSSGDTLWTRTFGGTNYDGGFSVQQTQDGGFIIAGTYSSGAPIDVYLIRTNSSGNTLWTKTFGGAGVDEGYSVQQTQDGGFIIAGNTLSFGAGNWDVYLIRTNSSGDTLWTKTFGGTDVDESYSVQQTKDGGFIIAGLTQSFGAGNLDVYLIRTDSSGDTLWTKTFGGTAVDAGYSVQQTEDGGYIIAGITGSFGAGYGDVYLIRLGKETGVEEKLNIKNQISKLEIGENPITNFANISYTVPSQSGLELKLYDLSGRCVKTLVNGQKPAGTYTTTLNSKDLKAGIYFVRLVVGGYKETKKLILMR
ncbi:MAG: T9SS type A sorting domain-containing protein [bacterium]